MFAWDDRRALDLVDRVYIWTEDATAPTKRLDAEDDVRFIVAIRLLSVIPHQHIESMLQRIESIFSTIPSSDEKERMLSEVEYQVMEGVDSETRFEVIRWWMGFCQRTQHAKL